MQTVTAHIDVSRPIGRRLVRELETKKCVKLQYPKVNGAEKRTYSLREVFEEGEKILSNHYGVDIKIKY